jgi:hypothetical protein
MSESATKPKRPYSITLICYFGVFYLGFIFWNTFNPSFSLTVQRLGLGLTIYFLISALALFLGVIGLWLMKKWGLYAFAAVLAINQVIAVISGRWNFGPLLILAIVGYVGYSNLSKMS